MDILDASDASDLEDEIEDRLTEEKALQRLKRLNGRDTKYSLELHERSRLDRDFRLLLLDDDLHPDPLRDESKVNFSKPLSARLFSSDEYTNMNATGHIPYVKKCTELNIVPSSKVLRYLPGATMSLAHYGVNKDGAIAIAEALKVNNTLTILDLEDNWIGSEGCAAIANALADDNKTISVLDMSRNTVGSTGGLKIVSTLATNNSITELRLAQNELNNTVIEKLALALNTNKSLIKLDLSSNKIGVRGGKHLAKMLANNVYIKELNLSWNSLREQGSQMIAECIANHNITLQRLDISWNGMSSKGGIAWGKALVANDGLVWLDISNNRMEGAAWPSIFQSLKENKTLRQVNLSGNYLSPEQAEELAQIRDERAQYFIDLDDAEYGPLDPEEDYDESGRPPYPIVNYEGIELLLDTAALHRQEQEEKALLKAELDRLAKIKLQEERKAAREAEKAKGGAKGGRSSKAGKTGRTKASPRGSRRRGKRR